MSAALTTPLGIAVVEDNDTLRELLVSYLAGPGRQVTGVDCGEELNRLLMEQAIQIVVLDVNLPYEDGFSIAQRLKHSHPEIRIVMLTARVRPTDRSQAYQTGVDVFLTKPTNPQELEAVVANLATRERVTQPELPTLLRQHRLLVVPQRGQLLLSPNEAVLLEQLALAPEKALHADALVAMLRSGGKSDFSRENLTVLVSRLRHKLAEQGLHAEAIKAVWGFGYRLELRMVLG